MEDNAANVMVSRINSGRLIGVDHLEINGEIPKFVDKIELIIQGPSDSLPTGHMKAYKFKEIEPFFEGPFYLYETSASVEDLATKIETGKKLMEEDKRDELIAEELGISLEEFLLIKDKYLEDIYVED